MDPSIQLIFALTGLVGTIGGVLISYLTLKHNFSQDKHQVKVELGKSIMINVPGIDPKKEQFTIMVASLGKVPFTVANVKISIGQRSGALFIPIPTGTHQIPVLLERDQTCNFWTEYEDALKGIKKLTKFNKIRIRACISDYAGNKFYSPWMKLKFEDTRTSKIIARIGQSYKSVLKRISP